MRAKRASEKTKDIKKKIADKAYLENAVRAIAPKVLDELVGTEELKVRKVRKVHSGEKFDDGNTYQHQVATRLRRLKASLREIIEREKIVTQFEPLLRVKYLSAGDVAMLRAYGCESVACFLNKVECERSAFMRAIIHDVALYPQNVRSRIISWFNKDVTTQWLVDSLSDVADVQLQVERMDEGIDLPEDCPTYRRAMRAVEVC